jgi:hypothetical protein
MHEAAVRALTQQEAALEALRARSGTILTAASVIASFLGGQAIARNGLNAWVVMALSAFALVVLLSIYTLSPTPLLRLLNEPKIARLGQSAQLAGFALMAETAFLGAALA